MRIGMFGTFDVENYGDLLFPVIAEYELKQRLENIEIVKYSYNEKKDSSWVYNVKSLVDLLEDSTGVQSLDCILIGGGHLIRFDKKVANHYFPPLPQIPHPTGYWLVPALTGIAAGRPVVWNTPGSSSELPEWAHGLLSFVLNQSAYVSVRDQLSLEALRKTGFDGECKVIPDTVFKIAHHFPRENLHAKVETMLSNIGIRRQYLVIQASSELETVTKVLLSNVDILSDFDVLVLPIGPILGDNNSHILSFLPQAKYFQSWPALDEIAGLVANSSGVIALSLHLSITALAYGLPVLRPGTADYGKYAFLRSSENIYFGEKGNLDGIMSFAKAIQSDSHHLCSFVKAAQSQVDSHWDEIAEICRKPQRRASLSKDFFHANLFLTHQESLGKALMEIEERVQVLITQEKALKAQIQVLTTQEQALVAQIQMLTTGVAEKQAQLNEIFNSNTWKAALLFRKIRFLLAPPHSYRARVLRRFINVIHSLFKRDDGNRELKEDLALIDSSGLFDEQWYLANNPDVDPVKVNPLLHYLREGGLKGRDPGPNFWSGWYLDTYEDVRKAGINPLVHYLKHGKDEGRETQPGYTIQPLKLWVAPAVPLWQKAVLAWREGGARLVWQKVRHKFSHTLFKSNIPLSETNVGSFLSGLPIEPPNLEGLRYQPLISVLMPTYNTPVQHLIAAVDSVRHQFYPRWEICICDDASSSKETIDELSKIAESDARIKVVFSPTNGGISAATNKAAGIAQGDYFALLDHDDEMTSDALYEIVKSINEDEDVVALYSDQDKIDANGTPHEPFFKPDWSPVFFRSVMYVGHLLVVKRELFKRVNGMNSQFDGIQDYEFMLRVSETSSNVKHIPKILYHWRKIPGSVAMGLDEKGDKIEILQVRAVNEHLSRLGVRSIATQHPKHRHRVLVQPKPRESYPLVSIIILTKDAPEHIGRCLQSVFERTTYSNYEVIVVDNGTTDLEALKALKDYSVKVIPFHENFNFSKANNIGVQNSQGEFIVLLNNDTEIITRDWIENLLVYCEFPDVGTVGPLLLYPNRTVQHAGIVLGIRGTADHVMRNFPSDSDGYAGSLSCPREVSAVTGACLMIKRSDYLDKGGLLEYYSTHYQDVDLCLRVLVNGKSNLFVPHAVLIHYEGSTRGKYYDYMDRALLLDTWGELIAKGDRFYNPNFTLTNQKFYVIK